MALPAALLATLVAGCHGAPSARTAAAEPFATAPPGPLHLVPRSYSTATGGAIPLARHQASGPPVVVMGTGRFVAPEAGVGAATQAAISPGGDVTLNFVNVDVRDVARSVLGDLLRLSFVVDPSVQGTVTLQTGRPIPRSAVLPTLQNALALDGIALVERDGIWRLVPLANATREAGLRPADRGSSPASSRPASSLPPTSNTCCNRCCRPAPRCAPMRRATR